MAFLDSTQVFNADGTFGPLSLVSAPKPAVGSISGPFTWSGIAAILRTVEDPKPVVCLTTRGGRVLTGTPDQLVMTQAGLRAMGDIKPWDRAKGDRLCVLGGLPPWVGDDVLPGDRAEVGNVKDTSGMGYAEAKTFLCALIYGYTAADSQISLMIRGEWGELASLQSLMIRFGIDSAVVNVNGPVLVLRAGDTASREALRGIGAGLQDQGYWKRLCDAICPRAPEVESERISLVGTPARERLIDLMTQASADPGVKKSEQLGRMRNPDGWVALSKIRRLDDVTGLLDNFRYLWRPDFVWDGVASRTEGGGRVVELRVPGAELMVMGDFIVGA